MAEDIAVYVIGDYNFTEQFKYEDTENSSLSANTIDYSKNIYRVKSLSDLPNINSRSISKPTAIIISQNVTNTYLAAEKTSLEPYLNAGYPLYFPQTTYHDMTDIFQELTGDPFNMTPVDSGNNEAITAYVFKDNLGNYYTGNVIVSGDSKQAVTDAHIIKETLSNRSLYENGKFQNVTINSAGDGFTPGYQWNQVSTWHKNTFVGSATGNSWFSEWICFYSTQTSDGDHYYAWAGEWSMAPDDLPLGGSWQSKYVKYQSNAPLMQSGVQLRDYEPTVEPTSYNVSLSAGINSDQSYNFGISFSWAVNELNFTDNSTPASDYCRLQWDYLYNSNYSTVTSSSKFVMIFKDTAKAGSYNFHHYRNAYMWVPNVIGEEAGGNYYTNYSFVA